MSPRYELLVKIASGGMGGVYVGRLRGGMGFEQLVAIKRPHAHLMESPSVRRSLMAEARMASLIRHANVVGVRDVEATDDTILLIMDYVEGASMLELMSSEDEDRLERIRAGLRVTLDVCAGLQAVHDLTDPRGESLGLVHRDVSPHNVLVGLDGVGRIADFGIAKSLNSSDPSTREGTIKGKVAYMAPEYLQGQVDQRCDVFSIGVILWELLTGRRLFAAESDAQTLHRVLTQPIPTVSSVAPTLGTAFDAVVARALERQIESRFTRAVDLMNALEAAMVDAGFVATHQDVARFVRSKVGAALAERRERVNACLRGASATSSNDDTDGSVGTQTLTLSKPPPRNRSRRTPLIGAAVGALGLLGAGLAIGRSAARPVVVQPPSVSASSPIEPFPVQAPASSTTTVQTATPVATTTASVTMKEPARPAPKRAPPKPTKPAASAADTEFHNPY